MNTGKKTIWQVFCSIMIILSCCSFICFGENKEDIEHQIIEGFIKEVVGDRIGKIIYSGNSVTESSKPIGLVPSDLGISYRKYYVYPKADDNSFYYTVYVADGINKVIFFRITDRTRTRVDIIKEKPSKDKWFTPEEATKSVYPFMKYLGIDKSPELTPPMIQEVHNIVEDLLMFKRDGLWQGILCYGRGVSAHVSLSNRRVEFFKYSPVMPPKNRKPEGDCPVEKVKKIAEEWLKSQKNLDLCKDCSPYINEFEKIKLLIAPGVNMFSLPDEKKWIDENFFYVWSVPFIYWEMYDMMDIETLQVVKEQSKGSVWVEVESLRVIGATSESEGWKEVKE